MQEIWELMPSMKFYVSYQFYVIAENNKLRFICSSDSLNYIY